MCEHAPPSILRYQIVRIYQGSFTLLSTSKVCSMQSSHCRTGLDGQRRLAIRGMTTAFDAGIRTLNAGHAAASLQQQVQRRFSLSYSVMTRTQFHRTTVKTPLGFMCNKGDPVTTSSQDVVANLHVRGACTGHQHVIWFRFWSQLG